MAMDSSAILLNPSRRGKIVPLVHGMTHHLEDHIHSMEKIIYTVFGEELENDIDPPFIKWQECDETPGTFSIYLLASGKSFHEIHNFFHEMISNWLIVQDPLHILSSRNLTFRIDERQGHTFYFAELLVHVEKHHHLLLIKANLPSLAEEIKRGASSTGYAKHILEMKRLSIGGKSTYVYEAIIKLMRRYPKIFKKDVFREIQHFFVHLREEFCAIRSVSHLTRLVASQYLFLKDLDQSCKISPQKRHLYFKFLQANLSYPFGLKKVLGIAIALNTLNDYEYFEQAHIIKAVQRVIPDVKLIADSFYSHRNKESKFLTLYLEIEKKGGFTLQDLKLLRRSLASELKNSIEYLSPSLFVPRNEEELYRNIVNLSQELKFVKDLPQAIISFKEQGNDFLKFDVILLRLLKEKSPSLLNESVKLPSHVRFIPEKVAQVGIVRKKYPKEANVFSLEVESGHFLRKNHSVDLVRARQHVVKLVEKLVGNFRDYNGGFLFKQNEQCDAIKQELGDVGKDGEFLIENIFYSLNPSIMQTLIPPKAGKELMQLFLKMLDCELPNKTPFIVEKTIDNEKLIVIIKVDNQEIKDYVATLLKETKTGALKLATAFIEVDGRYYACFLYLNPLPEEVTLFLNNLQAMLNAWQKKQKNLQVIKIHLPRAAQSLDPRIGADRTSGVVIKMLYEGLMRLDSEGNVEMGMAEKVDISPDGKRYTFTLRDALWSNGAPITSFDFEYAWKKILDPNFPSHYSFLFFSIKNAEACKKGSAPLEQIGIYAPDKKTFIVDLEYPFPNFLGITAHWTHAPLCKEIDQSHPGWSYHKGENYVCNGPFKLDVWKFNDDLQVIKNPFYWDAKSVKLDKIEMRIIEDDKKTLDMFHRGELDWFGDPMTRIPPHVLGRLKGSPFLCKNDFNGFFWLQINVERSPFKSKALRQALGLAIDKEYLIKNVLHCDDEPANRFYGLGDKKTSFDVERAKALFEEGLIAQGLTRKTMPQIIFSHSDIEEHEVISWEIAKQWERTFDIAIKFERVAPWKSYFEILSKHNYMIGGLAWYSRYDDPLYYLDLLYQKDKVTKWKDFSFQELIEMAKVEKDEQKREQYIFEADNIVMDAMPVIPLLYQKWRYLKNPRLKQVILSAIGQMDFRVAYLENEESTI